MPINFESLIQPGYWFSTDAPDVASVLGRVVFVFFLIFFVAGIGVRHVGGKNAKDRHDRAFVSKASTMLMAMGLLGAVLYFFSYENIRILGARFWYLIWLIITLVWTFFIMRFVKKEIPGRREREKERLEREKYLPKPKKK